MKGLGLFEGKVQRFKSGDLKVPQIGWNRLTWTNEAYARFPELPDATRSSILFIPTILSLRPLDYRGDSQYGEEFAAAVVTDNLLATQFHPEKSQENGLAILRQFVSSLT